MNGRFLYLNNAAGEGPAFFGRLNGHTAHVIQQYDADRIDLSPYHMVLLSMHADQVHLGEMSGKLAAYLDTGGTLVINGHVNRPFLPELSVYEPMEKRGLQELTIHREAEHPLFEDFSSEDLTTRRGVAGFYGRGTNPAPEGALVINSVGPDHVAVDWLYERPGGGRIFVHSGVELWMFLADKDPKGLTYVRRFFDWFTETSPKVA